MDANWREKLIARGFNGPKANLYRPDLSARSK